MQRLASGQAWLRSSGPAKLALRFIYLVIIDRGVAAAHQAVLVELPQLITVRSPPLSVCVVALILEAYGDAVISEAPEVLFESVVELASPLALQEVPDCLAALEELVAIAPLRVLAFVRGSQRADERTRTADLLITNVLSSVSEHCWGLLMPH